MNMQKRSVFGWIELLVGILLAGLGIYTLSNPQGAVKGVVAIYGIAAVASGIVDIVFYTRLDKRIGFAPSMLMVSGIIDILVGILLLFNLGAGAWAFSLLLPIWFIMHCIGRLANLDIVRVTAGKGQYWFSLIVNFVGLILGVLLIFRPFVSMASLGYLIAVYLLVTGIGCVVGALGRLGTR